MIAAIRYALVCIAETVLIRAYGRAEGLYRWVEDLEHEAIRARDRLRPEWWPWWEVVHERRGVQNFGYGVRDRRDAWAHAQRFATTLRPGPERSHLSEPVPAVRACVVRHAFGRRKVMATYEPDTVPGEARRAAIGGLRP